MPTKEEKQLAAIRCLRILCILAGLHDGGFPRQADIAVVKMMTENSADTEEAEKDAAKYVWDHLLGEPNTLDAVTLWKMYRQIADVFEEK